MMKQLLILSLFLSELRSDSNLKGIEMSSFSEIPAQEQFLRAWPGTMDTCITNVFCPNGRRRLFY